MTKRSIVRCILSLLLIAYLVVAISFTGKMAENAMCAGVDIFVSDSTGIQFVSANDIAIEIGNDSGQFNTKKIGDLNIDEIERKLNLIDKIEDANCVILKNGKLRVDVVPMQPVARIFENGQSYYINKEGKRISADIRYHIDVPVVVGTFDSDFQAVSLVPLLNHLKSDSTWNALVSTIKTAENHDIYLIPMIRGHVINIGDTSDIENKLSRLNVMYKEVLPIKGWNYYDTLSVKWKGQVVATRRVKKMQEPIIKYDELDENDDVSIETMQTMISDSIN